MAEKGYIVLSRAIGDSWVWKLRGDQRIVWIQLLLDARWAPDPDKIQLLRETIVVKRGQVWTTERSLADRAGVGRQVVRTAMKLLLQDGAISTQQLTRYGTLVTVRNYEAYQGVPSQPNPGAQPPPTHPQPNNNQGNQKTQKELCALPKRKRADWSPGFKSVREVYPQPRELAEAWKLWQQMKLEPLAPKIRAWVVAYEKAREEWVNRGQRDGEPYMAHLPYLKRFLKKKLWTEEISTRQTQRRIRRDETKPEEPNRLL